MEKLGHSNLQYMRADLFLSFYSILLATVQCALCVQYSVVHIYMHSIHHSYRHLDDEINLFCTRHLPVCAPNVCTYA